ncbi:MAG TPA: hypothetical protein VJU79_03020 [Candidatus Dormibacteraeota bacterium]|nr:hypothetical protein [Candidatus Dormibacteraeota bacterium]
MPFHFRNRAIVKMNPPTQYCADQEHSWSTPGHFAVVYCTRCGLTLSASFATTLRQIAQLPVTDHPHETA